MLNRKPIVAGSFYPAEAQALKDEVTALLARGKQQHRPDAGQDDEIWGVMVPHAGHVYCGRILGETLATAALPSTLIILCPNHTGHGRPLGVWPAGQWHTPLGSIPVNEQIATELIGAEAGFEPDVASHMGEHAIEVVLPFLQESVEGLNIVPITVGTGNPAILRQAGNALAKILALHPEAGVVISSDMNHYEDHVTTLAKDELALAKACLGDADGLLDVVSRERISMCGAPALALALYAANELGYKGISLTGHTTSGETFGDYDRTVGYAGLHLSKNRPN